MTELSYANCNTIKLMYQIGWSIEAIAKAKDLTEEQVVAVVYSYKNTLLHKSKSSNILGSKTEPYYETEEEMFNEPTYTYDCLSPAEKKIYDESRSNKQKLLP